MDINLLAVIPARGNSKGIPRKNLRLLNNKPLIYYVIKTALSSKYNLDTYVSSDDEEILNVATLFGAKTHIRDMAISDDETTLDPVVYSCYTYAKNLENKKYDYVITIQPTSPLLTTHSLDTAIKQHIEYTTDTTISVKEDCHLSWKKQGHKYLPNYKKRLNRQHLPSVFVETGAFLITKASIVSPNNRIGKNTNVYTLKDEESVDIDTYTDWNICEYYLQRKHILFVVVGNNEVGLGHVYNTLLVANDIVNHKITFLVDKSSQMAYDKISLKNYPVFMQKHNNIIDDIQKVNPDIVINDILDTNIEYIETLKKNKIKIINFEDLGQGAKKADLVINAIYPEKQALPSHYFGYRYFLLRDEFIYSKQKDITNTVNNVLVAFGGVDNNNYTEKVINVIYHYCQKNNIKITVITGFGYQKYNELEQYKNIDILNNVSNIAQYILQADIVFTSAGRTSYEIASIGTPAIVLAQNKRETTHFFASSTFGFINLGLGYNVNDIDLYQHFVALVSSKKNRKSMNLLMKKYNLRLNRIKVNNLIKNIINETQNAI